MKFRKKPVVIEAEQFAGENWRSILEFIGPEGGHHASPDPDTNYVVIYTLEGNHRADIGDWIIKGVKGEFYPIKNDIFLETYEALDAAQE
jgi:hypothetical protein